ncbi:MAG: transglutaminase domain-containing protein [Firmicutes bacterium]|nr:transglutaminase domain-containing protein [Bacillota bacterium]
MKLMNVENGKTIAKKSCALLVAVCLMLCTILQAGTVTASAASSSDKALKTKVTQIVNKKVDKKDTKEEKLEKLFTYVEKNYKYGRPTKAAGSKGWEKTFAMEMYKKKKGSCYHFAAAYAFLAQKATGYKVRVAIGKTNGFSGKLQDHSWVELKIGKKWFICDPNMDKFAEDSSGKYFLKERSKLKKTYNKFKKVKYTTIKL